MNDGMQQNLQESVEHLGLLSTFHRPPDVVMLGEEVFFEDI